MLIPERHPARIFVALLLFFTAAYFPLLNTDFMFHDDFIAVEWDKRSILSHSYLAGNIGQGRLVAHLIYCLSHFFLTLQNARYLRFCSVLLVAYSAYLTFKWLTESGYGRKLSLAFVLSAYTLPVIQVFVIVVSFQHHLVGILCAQLAAFVLYRGISWPRSRAAQCAVAACLLLAALFNYPTSACFFLFMLLAYFYAPGEALNGRHLRRCMSGVAVLLSCMGIFYFFTKALLRVIGEGGLPESSGRRLVVNTDLLGQLKFYAEIVWVRSANFWRVWVYNDVGGNASLAYAFIVLILALAGIWFLVAAKPRVRGFSRGKEMAAAGAFTVALLLLTVAPVILSTPGTFVPHRTLTAHMFIQYFLALSGLIGLCRSLGRKQMNLLLILLVIFSGGMCAWTLQKYIARPLEREISYLRAAAGEYAAAAPNAEKPIVIIRPLSRSNFMEEPQIDDEYGVAVSNYPVFSSLLMLALLRERNIPLAPVTCENALIGWRSCLKEETPDYSWYRYGKMDILYAKTNRVTLPNSFVIDTNLIPVVE